MKESALKESESKQVVLATYSMAAEGLDIKTLTTLFMTTPMTNIEQSVGRILRQKHEFAPVVVDIIDTHDNFSRQWQKRKQFYKKQNYKIIQTKSSIYEPNPEKWKVVFEPTECKQKKEVKKEKQILQSTSRSSSDKSIAEDTDSDEEEEEGEEEDLKPSVCLLKFKK
jgi:superfamily II DNA or RNA helicase